MGQVESSGRAERGERSMRAVRAIDQDVEPGEEMGRDKGSKEMILSCTDLVLVSRIITVVHAIATLVRIILTISLLVALPIVVTVLFLVL